MAIQHKSPTISDFDPSIRQIMSFRQLTPITNAQALALFTTQIPLFPAFGAGTVLVFDEIKIQYIPGPGPTAFTINGGKLSVNYTNLAGLQVGLVTTVGFLDQTTGSTSYGLNLNTTTGHLPTPNAPLVLAETVANLTLGDGSLLTDLRYRIEPTAIR